jgi:hypothetical protein
MESFKKYSKVIFAVVLATMIRIIVAQFSGPDPVSLQFSQSFLVKQLGIGAVAGPAILIVYFFLAVLFIKLEWIVSGNAFVKALKFSIFGLIAFWGFVECFPLFDSPVYVTLSYGIIEGLMYLLLFVLLALIMKVKKTSYPRFSIEPLIIIIIAAVFTAGRYISYYVGIESGYKTSIAYTFFWTLIMGIIIGTMYNVLFKPGYSYSVRNAVIFSVIVFGTFWMTFNLFGPLLFDTNWLPFIPRVTLDILYVMAGVIVAEKLLARRKIQ